MHGWVCDPCFLPGHIQVTQAPTSAQVPTKAVDPRTGESAAWAEAEDTSGAVRSQNLLPKRDTRVWVAAKSPYKLVSWFVLPSGKTEGRNLMSEVAPRQGRSLWTSLGTTAARLDQARPSLERAGPRCWR